MDNPIHQIIYDKVVKPAINDIAQEAEGIITYVYYTEQVVDIEWMGVHGESYEDKYVPLPRDADGVFRQAVHIGDRVKLGFINGKVTNPYISIVYGSRASQVSYKSKYGAGITKGIGYLFGGN